MTSTNGQHPDEKIAEPASSDTPGHLDADGPTVIVVGSANIDLVFTEVERIPGPGETVLSGPLRALPGGKGANQASAVATLGTRSIFVGRVGNDDFGDQVVADLEARGVDLGWLTRVDEPTGVAVVLIDRESENSIVVAPGANAALSPQSAADAPPIRDAVVLASLEVPLESVVAWARSARRRGWRFVLNPAPAQRLPAELLRLVTALTPNRHELDTMGVTPDDLLSAGVEAVVVTLGADGAELHRAREPVVRLPALPIDTVDTTGAGDTFNGAFASALAHGRAMEDALAFACAAGALATRAVGARASQPTLPEVEARLGQAGFVTGARMVRVDVTGRRLP